MWYLSGLQSREQRANCWYCLNFRSERQQNPVFFFLMETVHVKNKRFTVFCYIFGLPNYIDLAKDATFFKNA